MDNLPVICLQLELSRLKTMFFRMKAYEETKHLENIQWKLILGSDDTARLLDHTCTGARTAHGPPSNCSSAVCSFSQKTNPVIKDTVETVLKNVYNNDK